MNAVHKWLKHADPVAREQPLTDEDAQRMRRAVLAAVEERPPFLSWRHSVWVAATVAVAFVAVVGVTRVRSTPEPAAVAAMNPREALAPPSEPATRRQLQFATPGGTRVIWVFNPEFEP